MILGIDSWVLQLQRRRLETLAENLLHKVHCVRRMMTSAVTFIIIIIETFPVHTHTPTQIPMLPWNSFYCPEATEIENNERGSTGAPGPWAGWDWEDFISGKLLRLMMLSA